ncbi:glycosyltransferase [Falsiroseomonas sp. HC035]|uniref:glycosyltransferase n=1 Tax=Falsiroseomonas sp. HC035 TaxID=3390999 RepID=UPI003D31678F
MAGARRVAIHTLGTRGDVQPFVALGRALRQAGFEPCLATAPRFADFVRDHGLPFAPLPGEMLDMIDTPIGRAALGGRHALAAKCRLLRAARPMFRRLLDAQWQAAQGADIIVAHPKALGGMSIADALGIPGFVALPLPGLTPTVAFPSPLLPFADLGPLNRASHVLMRRGGDWVAGGALRHWRAEVLGLPPGASLGLRGRPAPVLYAYSPSLVPVPWDWSAEAVVTGSWVLEEPEWVPPAALLAFLAAGPPPVYVGFGSLPAEDARPLAELAMSAAAQAGQRAVLATGWGGLDPGQAPASVHVLDGAPHGWLFPRMAAVVHHGGAGTTAAGLRAGRPSVICPFFGDQPFWGRRVHSLGAGPAPIPRRALSVDRLAEAVRLAVDDPVMRRNAKCLGAAMASEDGVGSAVAAIEQAWSKRR